MISRWFWACCILTIFSISTPSLAHEVRPALLELSETSEGVYDVTWKQPLLQGRRLRLEPILPAHCEESKPQRASNTNAFLLRKWQVTCDTSQMADFAITIQGLERTLTDVFLRVNRADGKTTTAVLRPASATWKFAEESQTGVSQYVIIGIEHILLGWDHLIFVFMLLLIVRDAMTLLKTVTAFTIAHSITLGLSAVGGLSLSQGPVEALIALSIVVLAVEAAKPKQLATNLIAQAPWFAAIAFGLLHGLGFAGALSEIGLPEGARLWALLLFNIGVEIGQLVFIAFCLAVWAGMNALLQRPLTERARLATVYIGGGIAAFWFIERAAGILFA